MSADDHDGDMVLDLAMTVQEIVDMPPPSFTDGERYSSHIDYLQRLANQALDRDHTAFFEHRTFFAVPPDPAEIAPGQWQAALNAISDLSADMWEDGENGFQAFTTAQALAAAALRIDEQVDNPGIPLPVQRPTPRSRRLRRR